MFLNIYLALTVSGLLFTLASLFHGDGDVSDLHSGVSHGESGSDSHSDLDGSSDHGTGLRDFLSLRSLFLIIFGFGLTGSVMTVLGAFGFIVPVVGFLFGLILAYLGIKAVRILLKQEATTTTSLNHYFGMNGTVTVEIPGDGIGQVLAASYNGEERYLIARSSDDSVIPAGSQVEVVGVVAGELLVKRVGFFPQAV